MPTPISDSLPRDRDAYLQVVQEHAPAVRAFLGSYLSNPEVVNDLAQETFIAAYDKLGDFRPDGDMRAWLKGFARNQLRSYLRSQNRRRNVMARYQEHILTLTEAEVFSATHNDNAEALQALRSCMRKLAPKQQRLVDGRYLLTRTVQSIADELACTPNAVSMMLHRTRVQLRACMSAELNS